jgi:amino acid transporter
MRAFRGDTLKKKGIFVNNRIVNYAKSKRKLKKQLGLFHLISIGTGAMISSGLFVLPGLAFAQAGPAIIIAYVLAGISLIPVVLSEAELVTARPKSGVIHHYISESLGHGVGTFGGFAAWLSLSLKTSFALIGIGVFVLLFNPGFTELEIKLVAVACCLVFTAVNLTGVKLTVRIQMVSVIALFSLLIFYTVAGFSSIQVERYTPLIPMGTSSVLVVTGMVYIAFGGLTKIGAVAGEVKKPGRNLPLALLISLGVMIVLYGLVIFVTVGLVDPSQLHNSLTSISLGAATFMGRTGSLLMGFTALLAFVTTANAGILTASRDSMAMGEDRILPRAFKKISKRGVPRFSVLFTAIFIITAIMLLDFETMVKTASALRLVLFALANVSVIAMRESKLETYQPKFRSPLYPWTQILGIGISGVFISLMGPVPLIIVGIFAVFSAVWFLLYRKSSLKRDYALQHVFKRINGNNSNKSLWEKENNIDNDDTNST